MEKTNFPMSSKFSVVGQVDDALIKEMIELDKLVFKGDDVGGFDRCKQWIERNPDIYTVLLQGNKVIGYINFMPVTNEAYQVIKQGKLKDYELNSSHIAKFTKNVYLKCLFTSIVIHPNHQNGFELAKLWKGFINKLKRLDVKISSVVMDCVTEMGEKCARNRLGAKFVTNSQNGKIYEGNLNELND